MATSPVLAPARTAARLCLRGVAALTALVAGLVAPVLSAPDAHATPADASVFVPISPCRAFDSRDDRSGPLAAGASVRLRLLDASDGERCDLPPDASAVSVTVTAVEATARGFVTLSPAGVARPTTSNLNYAAGETRANGALVKIGTGGSIDLFTRAATHVVVDVNGYFVSVDGPANAGRLVPVGPLRLVDTRETGGRLPAGGELVVTVPEALHPDDISAAVVTVTLVDTGDRSFATAYPTGEPRPTASIVNADRAGQVRAATVLVRTADRRFTVYARASTDLVVDITGVFTADEAPASADGLFVPVDPQRLLDTRESGSPVYAGGAREIALPSSAAAVALNLTATEPSGRSFWTAYPAGNGRPETSSLNVSAAGEVAANLAVVPAAERGVAVFGRATSHVVVDTTGYFTGTPRPSPLDVPSNVPPPDRRVVIIGDSGMAGIRSNGALTGLRGANFETHLQTCRRLVYPSCSVLRSSAPLTALEELRRNVAPAGSDRDVLVIATGYNDWIGRFATAGHGFDDLGTIMAEARAKGFRTVVWVAMRSTEYHLPPGASRSGFADNAAINRAVRAEAARFPELVIWDRDRYAAFGTTSWYYADGVHQTRSGSWGIADWISRHVAALDGLPCPMPWAPGRPIESPCPDPDGLPERRGGVPDVRALYGLG